MAKSSRQEISFDPLAADSPLTSAIEQAELLVSHLKSAADDVLDVHFLLTHALAMPEFARVVADDRALKQPKPQ